MKRLKLIAALLLGAALLPAQQAVKIVDGQGNGVPAICTNVAQVSVSAAATTKIITGVAAQRIYICSFVLTISAAGTGQITSGTGSNCGTSAAVLTPAFNIGTTLPLQYTPQNSNATTPAAVAFDVCVSAVTGNVTGMISYAIF